MTILGKYWELMRDAGRLKLSFLILLMIFTALVDMLGVASILPFMLVLTQPELIQQNSILAFLYELWGAPSIHLFYFGLGVLVFVALISALLLRAFTTYVTTHFGYSQEYRIGRRLVHGYLSQPYEWFLSRHSADLGKNILSDVNNVVADALVPVLNMFAQLTVAIALIALLMFVDLVLALSVGATLGLMYFCVFAVLSSYIKRLGNERLLANLKRFTILNNAFGAVKEVKITGAERSYIHRFSMAAEEYAKSQAKASVIGQMPRFVLEAIAFGGVLSLTLILVAQRGDLTAAIPTISLYALAGYRLMPALQQIYSSATSIRFASTNAENLYSELMSTPQMIIDKPDGAPLKCEEYIQFDDVVYSYQNSGRSALNGLTLKINARTFVGIVGVTGSGKTTAIDVLLGLLTPISGRIVVDGQVVDVHNRHLLNKSIGYVPQQIFLTDDTIQNNIAFNLPPDKIDHEAVVRAAKIANLHQFVTSELEEGYETFLGEGGVRLSGGQRQRIGIARALYNEPNLLVMDEATSSLDNLTERDVMAAVKSLGSHMTVILIAHRLSTVRDCDEIHLLESGKLKESGTYLQLLDKSEKFANMVKA